MRNNIVIIIIISGIILFGCFPYSKRSFAPKNQAEKDMIEFIYKKTGCYRYHIYEIGDKLFSISIAHGGIDDISFLQNISIIRLDLAGNPISDLTPLKNMELVFLRIDNTKVKDLKSLKGMELEYLYLENTMVNDLSPLAGMPLPLSHWEMG